MAKPKEDLAARIEQIKADCDAFIDARANELKASYPELPVGVLRQTISRGRCPCDIALNLLEDK